MDISRREFCNRTAAGLAAAALLPETIGRLSADPLGLPIGSQSWPVRQLIAQDFPGTLRKLSAVGYQRIEMCSPMGYAGLGFGSLAKMKGSELRRIIEDADLHCESSHFGLDELQNHLDDRIAWAKEMGLKIGRAHV